MTTDPKIQTDTWRIFLAEDNQGDVWLIQEALRRQSLSVELSHYATVEEAMERLPAETNIEGFDVKTFETPHGLLRSDEFNAVAQTIRPMLDQVRERIHQQAALRNEA